MNWERPFHSLRWKLCKLVQNGGRSYKVIPQVAQEFRENEAMLDQYYVRTGGGDMVPLASIATFSKSVEPSERLQFNN